MSDVMFKALFAYAVLRGVLDSLGRRRNPRGRYLALKLARDPRLKRLRISITANTAHVTTAMNELHKTVTRTSCSFQTLSGKRREREEG